MGKKSALEWISQAEYDLGTADAMHRTGRYIYCVFMCHLSIEKALKGFYSKEYPDDAPRTHNLNYLLDKIKIEIPEDFRAFIGQLNDKSVPTRYPNVLEKILQDLRSEESDKLLSKTKDIVEWAAKNIST